MFGIGEGELAIILVFGFLLFGPDKLPQMGRTIGRALRQFRETQEKMTSVVQSEIIDPVSEAAQAPLKPTRVEESDDDDDDDEDVESAPVVKETFAERRARLAAEKAAKEAAASGEDVDDAAFGEAEAPADQAVDAADEPVDDAEDEEDEEPAEDSEPEIRTTADLYARRPHKRKREVVEDLARELADDDTEKGGEE